MLNLKSRLPRQIHGLPAGGHDHRLGAALPVNKDNLCPLAVIELDVGMKVRIDDILQKYEQVFCLIHLETFCLKLRDNVKRTNRPAVYAVGCHCLIDVRNGDNLGVSVYLIAFNA